MWILCYHRGFFMMTNIGHLCITDREVCPALVLHAEWPSGSVRRLSLRDQPGLLQRGKSHSYSCCIFLWTGPGPFSRPGIWPHNKRVFILYPHRTACMTAVTVRKVRTACALQSPPMSMPVQLQESRLATGGILSAVSSEELWNKRVFLINHKKSKHSIRPSVLTNIRCQFDKASDKSLC